LASVFPPLKFWAGFCPELERVVEVGIEVAEIELVEEVAEGKIVGAAFVGTAGGVEPD